MRRLFLLLVILVCIPIVSNAQIPTDGLIAYYPFNGNANDESGNGHTGVISGAVFTNDRFGTSNKALIFDGVSNYVEVADDPAFSFGSNMTLSAWIKFAEGGGEDPRIISKGWETGFEFFTEDISAERRLGFVFDDNQTAIYCMSIDNLKANTVYHVAATFNGSEMKLYINGTLNATQAYSGSVPSNTNAIKFGVNSVNGSDLFKGVIDDIRMYNRTLTDAEVLALYHDGGWPLNNDGLVAYYPFNGDAKDASGNGHDGTVSGATPTADRFGNAGQAYLFPGSGPNMIQVSTSAALDLDYGTFCIWYYCTDEAGQINPRFFWKDSAYQVCIENWAASSGPFAFYSLGAPGDIILKSSEHAPVGLWHFFCAVKDSQQLLFYLDAAKLCSLVVQGPLLHDPSDLFIGNGADPMNGLFKGALDDFRIYNRWLSDSEIQALYHEGGWMGNRTLTLTSPNGGEIWPIGSTQKITWSSSGVANVKIELSIDDGTTWQYPPIVSSTDANAVSYSWVDIPNEPTRTARLRISDIAGTTSATSNAFVIRNKNTVVVTHGMSFTTGTQWGWYKFQFALADAVSPDRQICLIHKGETYRALYDYIHFAGIADDKDIETLIGMPSVFSRTLALDPAKDVVFVFDWVDESDILDMHGHLEAAADVLSAALLENARTYPWLLEKLHFIGHSRGTVVNSEAIERLMYFASSDMLPVGVVLDKNIHMTTLDAHPAGHFPGQTDAKITAMLDDYVNSANITMDGKRIGVVGWKAADWKTQYIDNYYETTGTTGIELGGRGLYLPGIDDFPGSRFNFRLDEYFTSGYTSDSWHGLVTTWYQGTVDTDPSTTKDKFGTGEKAAVIDRAHWYTDGIGKTQGFYNSNNRVGLLSDIASAEGELIDISSDGNFGASKLVFDGDFSWCLVSSFYGSQYPGWQYQGGSGSGTISLYDGWVRNEHIELWRLKSDITHNYMYFPKGLSRIYFRMKVSIRGASSKIQVKIGDKEVGSFNVGQTSNYQQQSVEVPGTDRGTVNRLTFALVSGGFDIPYVWIDDVSFEPPKQIVASVACPVDLHVFDALGNHTGPTSDSTWATDIPGSTYHSEPDTVGNARKTATLPPPPAGTQYRFEIRARGTPGLFNFQIEDYSTGTQTNSAVFDSVVIFPESVARCSLTTVSPTLTLSLDRSGLGGADTNISISSYLQNCFIAAHAGLHGSISPRDTTIVNYGDSLMFIVKPDSSYAIATLEIDGSPVTPTSSYKFRKIQGDHSIAVTFSVATSALNLNRLPKEFVIDQNYPNPFNPSTTIKYELPKASQVTLTVYDMLGRQVSVLVNEKRDAGVHEVKFDGSGLASGVYLYRLTAGSFVQTKRLLLLR